MISRASTRRILSGVLTTTALVGASVSPAVAAPRASAAHARHTVEGRLQLQKAVAGEVLKGVYERGDTSVVDRFVDPGLVQHDPALADGSAALKALAVALHAQFPHATYNTKHVLSEGDLVVVHANLILTPGTLGSAVVDLFRFRAGKIAEHWNAVQEVPATTANGNDMFSTVSEPRTSRPTQHWLTAANKALAVRAFDEFLVRKDLTALDRYWAPEYHQHSPTIADGVEGARAGIGFLFTLFPDAVEIPKRVVAEGDFVAFQAHFIAVPGTPGTAVFDLFRIRDGKIVEHWDVLQDVPATSANDNTMF